MSSSSKGEGQADSYRILLGHIEKILDLEVTIGREDNLLSIGFDSLRIIALVNRLRAMGYLVSFSDFIAQPKLAHWASLLAKKEPRKIEAALASSLPEKLTLSPMQHAYWVGAMPDQPLGNVAAHLYAEFDTQFLEPSRLEKAIFALVRRHSMLRLNISPDGHQKVLDTPPNEVYELLDFRALPQREVNSILENLRQEKSQQKIFSQRGKVIEITLSLLPSNRARLHIDVDMLAADAMSYRLLIDELARLYRGEELAPLTYSYQAYLVEKQQQKGEAWLKDQEWWQRKLDTFPNSPELPLNSNHNFLLQAKPQRLFDWFPATERLKLEEFSKNYQVSMSMVFLTVFAEVVALYAKEKQFFLNIPLFNRDYLHPEVEAVVGDFSSSILLPLDFSYSMTIVERIREVTNVFIEIIRHSNYSALEILRDLGRRRGTPVLAPVVYTSAIGLGELFSSSARTEFGKPIWIISQGPQVYLDAQITELEGGLLVNWDIREGIFLPGVAREMFNAYIDYLHQLSADSVDEKTVLSATILKKQIKNRERFNHIFFPVSNRLLHQGFFEMAQNCPNKTAIYWRENSLDYQINYGELAKQALKIAQLLISRGVSLQSGVVVSLKKSVQQIATVIGILAAGATYIPIHRAWPALRKKQILSQAKAEFYVTDVADDMLNQQEKVCYITLKEGLEEISPLEAPIYPSAEMLAYIIFTSGSTGEPKGVAVSHRAVMNTLDVVNHLFSIQAQDISLAFSSLEFDLSVQDIFGLFNVGGSMTLPSEEDHQDLEVLLELIQINGVTQLCVVPSVLELLLSEPGSRLQSLKNVLLAGDKIPPGLYRRLKQVVPECQLAGLGGATETAIHCTYFKVEEEPAPHYGCIPYGQPLHNLACRVVDTLGNDCANWVMGELWVSGPSLAQGYVGNRILSEKKFVKYQGETWYRTGDMVRYTDEGIIEYIGRIDSQVKIRGYRVELGEIEAVLNRMAEVKKSLVQVMEKNNNLIAFVELHKPLEDKERAALILKLQAALESYLPNYMVPQNISVVERFPLTENAKVDRKKLLSQYENTHVQSQELEAKTALEKLITKQFAKALKVSPIYLENNFFELGGDSIIAIKLVSFLRQQLDFENIFVADLFKFKTPRALINHLKSIEGQAGLLETTAQIMLELEQLEENE
ncbi:MAG: amino acid adenylation domain-containing protein [Neisseriaceae bacterium]